jgi:alpha-methylacyl-CoA racemase
LSFAEAADHPQLAERGTLVTCEGVCHPAPAPRFSRTPSRRGGPAPAAGAHSREVFEHWDVPDVEEFLRSGALINGGTVPPDAPAPP